MSYHKTERAWNIVFEESETWANGLIGTLSTHTVGNSASLELLFRSRYHNDDPPFPKDHVERAQKVVEQARYAGSFATNVEQATGDVLFREQHNGPSLLVKLEPDYEDHLQTGVWGLLEGVSDSTVLEEGDAQLAVDVTILAPADEYDNHAEVRRDLEMRGL